MTQPNHKDLIARLEGWIDALNEAESFPTHAMLPIMRECLTALETRPAPSEERARECERIREQQAIERNRQDAIDRATDTQPVAGGGCPAYPSSIPHTEKPATTDRAIVLEEALRRIAEQKAGRDSPDDYNRGWEAARYSARKIALAALTDTSPPSREEQ